MRVRVCVREEGTGLASKVRRQGICKKEKGARKTSPLEATVVNPNCATARASHLAHLKIMSRPRNTDTTDAITYILNPSAGDNGDLVARAQHLSRVGHDEPVVDVQLAVLAQTLHGHGSILSMVQYGLSPCVRYSYRLASNEGWPYQEKEPT